jgi:hypothetical protein
MMAYSFWPEYFPVVTPQAILNQLLGKLEH